MLHVYLKIETVYVKMWNCIEEPIEESEGRHSPALAPKLQNLFSVHRRFVAHQPQFLLPTGRWRHTEKQGKTQRQHLQDCVSQTLPHFTSVPPADTAGEEITSQRWLRKLYTVTLPQTMPQSLRPHPSSSGLIYRNSQLLFLACKSLQQECVCTRSFRVPTSH